AMLPFCGYNMADYFDHWLEMGRQMTKPPKIFNVNWFRTDESGNFLWPGYGENLRVLEWIIDRTKDKAKAAKTPIGYVPTPESLDMTGLDLSKETMEHLLEVNPKDWEEELESISDFFNQFGDRLPQLIWDEYEALCSRIKKRIENYAHP
ncbi:phosphoenolpyruvate carboxykinase (GTP), partial [bacterium]|nr:phosphoenolpyruvate carboxykinase (GTP) [bacterium]